LHRRWLAVVLLLLIGTHCIGAPASEDATTASGWAHAYATYGAPKYPRGFAHFDYVNPDAPKGGTLYLRNPDRRTSFDKFNPFTVKGNSPAGVMIFMFETLAIMSGDELSTMYGLLAEDMQVSPRRVGATAGAEAPRGAAGEIRHELCLHQPRPRSGARDGASRAGDEGRRDHRAG